MSKISKTVSKTTPARGFVSKSLPPVSQPVVAPKEIAKKAEAEIEAVEETQKQFRKVAEDQIERGRDNFKRLQQDAEATAGSVQTSLATARSGFQALNSQAFDAVKQHADIGFGYLSALLSARDLKDFFSLHAEFSRKQVEIYTAQAKELSIHVQKIATESSAPLKAAAGYR